MRVWLYRPNVRVLSTQACSCTNPSIYGTPKWCSYSRRDPHTNDAGTVWFPAVGAAVAQPAGNHTTERIVPLVGCERCASHHRSHIERER